MKKNTNTNTNNTNNTNIFSLNNMSCYNKNINNNICEILNKYSELLIEYYNYIIENIKIKNKELSKFIIIRGLETLTNIFNILLSSTKNLDLTYLYCQKSFYLFVEFICQISEDDKKFLQLTSKDATMYVYKKTIFEINNEYKKNDYSQETKIKLDNILEYIKIYKKIMIKIVESESELNNIKSKKYIIKFQFIHEQFIHLDFNYENIKNIKIIVNLIDFFYYNTNIIEFFDIIKFMLKKIIKKTIVYNEVERKIFNEDIEINLKNMSSEKFVNWLFIES